MNCRDSQKLIDLLHAREAEFVTVWKCENEVRRILNMPDFPFTLPPELPSRRKPVKPAVKNKNPRANNITAVKNKKLRPLNTPAENAYRTVCLYNGKQEESFQTERDLLEMLLTVDTGDFKLLSVETVLFNSMDDWKTGELLWSCSDNADDMKEN